MSRNGMGRLSGARRGAVASLLLGVFLAVCLVPARALAEGAETGVAASVAAEGEEPVTYRSQLRRAQNVAEYLTTHSRCPEGQLVVITLVAEEGYYVDSVIIEDDSGNRTLATRQEGDHWSYYMPASNVSIDVILKRYDGTYMLSWNKLKDYFVWDMPDQAKAGEVVTFTATPKRVDAVVSEMHAYNWSDLSEVPLTQVGENTWSFTMPEAVVVLEGEVEYVKMHDFPDVPDDLWCSGAINWAYASGLITGYADGTFGPADALTRGQLAKILWNRAGQPAVGTSGAAAFTDCDLGAFYAEPVAWCVANGYMTGYADGTTFGPEDTMTREQLITVLWRLEGEPDFTFDLSIFPDAPGVSDFAYEAMRWAAGMGIVTGQGTSGMLDPQGDLERGQAATIFMRLYARG